MLSRFRRVARKLRGRDLEEVRVRGTQAMAALLERSGWGDGMRAASSPAAPRFVPEVEADAAARLAEFRARGVGSGSGRMPRFFGGLDSLAATVAALRARCPGDEADVLARAERVLAGRFDLLGYEGLSFGAPIDWHLDPVAGKRAPDDRHWSRVPYLDPAVVGDHKVVWELNRHQYFVTLGQAYAYTGDERYARVWAAHLEAWADANPPKRGINWASALEAAYRAISWVWSLHYFRHSPGLTPALFARVLGLLDVHGRHVERYLSTYFSPNTHLTGEALGLLYLGTTFPELAAAERWRETGRAILLEQVRRQVRPDGVYFEQASQYHRYTAEIFLHLFLLASRNGDAATAGAVRDALSGLFGHLLHLARPDGTLPLLGDDDGGRLVQLDGRPARELGALLAIGAASLGRADLAAGARLGAGKGEDDLAAVCWLLGPDEGLARLDALPPTEPTERSRAFADGGYYVMRERWDRSSAWSLIDCGPHGTMNCGHAHADALALEAAVGARPLLVDSGTYTYVGAERNEFRHGRSHNTVTVDDESSSVPGTPFAWTHIARCSARVWESTPTCDFFEGAHDGFARLADPATHERTVLLVKGGDVRAPYWIVRDRVSAAGRHAVAVHWHAAPGLALGPIAREADGGEQVELLDAAGEGTSACRLTTFGGHGGSFRAEAGWVSFAYGARTSAPVLRWRQEQVGTQDVITFVLPTPADGAPLTVRELELAAGGAGRVFRVEGATWSDLVFVGAGAPLECDGIVADADWAIVRRPAGGRAPTPIAVRGGTLRLDGADLNRS